MAGISNTGVLTVSISALSGMKIDAAIQEPLMSMFCLTMGLGPLNTLVHAIVRAPKTNIPLFLGLAACAVLLLSPDTRASVSNATSLGVTQAVAVIEQWTGYDDRS